MTAEDRLQIAVVRYFRYQYPDVVILHIPNGGARNPLEGAKFKRMGVMAGAADLFIMCIHRSAGKLFHGFFIELKTDKGIQSNAQKYFQKEAEDAGYKYQVIRSVDEFIAAVNAYLN